MVWRLRGSYIELEGYMLLSTFLNILGACVGFMSALYFAFGALMMTAEKINIIAATYWDANRHWGDSIAEQRADYIAGALLLLLSFSAQLAANLVPPAFAPSLLQPFGCAIAEIVAATALLLVCSVLLRNSVAKSTMKQVHILQEAELEKEKQAAKKVAP